MFSWSCPPPRGAAEQAGAPGLPACSRGGPTTTSEAMEAVNPSTQHIPTTVILSESSCSVVCVGVGVGCGVVVVSFGVSTVWPWGISALCRLDSRRVAWPHLCTLGRVLRATEVEWSAIHPVPAPLPVLDPQLCPMCPHPRRG